jgi:putative flippase GtrA
MADLSRRGDYTPRRTREQRAFRLAVAGGTAGAVAVVTFVVAIVTSLSFAIPVIAAIIAAVCFFLFRRIVSPS